MDKRAFISSSLKDVGSCEFSSIPFAVTTWICVKCKSYSSSTPHFNKSSCVNSHEYFSHSFSKIISPLLFIKPICSLSTLLYLSLNSYNPLLTLVFKDDFLPATNLLLHLFSSREFVIIFVIISFLVFFIQLAFLNYSHVFEDENPRTLFCTLHRIILGGHS